MSAKKKNVWQRLEETVFQLPVFKQLVEWSKTHSLPGFFGVPIYDVMVFLYNETRRVAIVMRANAVAFSFFLSLFPAIIALFTLLAMLPVYDVLMVEINNYIDYVMPNQAGEELKQTIQNLVRPDSGVLSISFLLALFFASNGMMALMAGFEKSHLKSFRRWSGLHKRLLAIGLTLVLGLMLVASVVMIILGKFMINWVADSFDLPVQTRTFINIFRWLVILALFYFGIAFIYRYGVALRRKLPWLTPGATLASLLSIASSVLFSLYVNAFDTYNKFYGSIGTIIVLMLWIQINCFFLMVGFELNASIAVNRDIKQEQADEA
ncbi:MAG: hypothetical protein KatS3mg029_0325 [Saprospiraceae bacterium]|nr:MAG: hypothetical protein KatS3mg029_0325 [Saprospiraceae bacterium]